MLNLLTGIPSWFRFKAFKHVKDNPLSFYRLLSKKYIKRSEKKSKPNLYSGFDLEPLKSKSLVLNLEH